MEPTKILDIIVKKYRKELGKNLVGIYLHGSLAMGCYTNTSDIDFLVVVRERISMRTKRNLIQSIIHLNSLPKKGIEMSIILEEYARKFVYPTPFELHYSNCHRDKYLSDENYICGGMTDWDLAAHMTIVKYRGICLYGKKIEETFGDVPKKDYIDSILYDVENAKEEIIKNPVYIILNLCRVLCYLKEDDICSKLEGGNWGKKVVPQQYRKIVDDAVKIYSNELKEIKYDEDILVGYADYMMKEINKYI